MLRMARAVIFIADTLRPRLFFTKVGFTQMIRALLTPSAWAPSNSAANTTGFSTALVFANH